MEPRAETSAPNEMLLYGTIASRTRRCLWTLEELGIEYKFHRVDLTKGEHRGPDYLRLNPNAKVPTLVDGEFVLFESAAICQYLARKTPGSRLLPDGTDPRESARHDQWMSWVLTELEQPLWTMVKHRYALPESLRIPEMLEVAQKEWRRPARVLAEHLEDREFMMGEQFTLADIFVGQTLHWARGTKVELGSGSVEEYADRVLARPAFLASSAKS
jgi:glutathione S-transferase